MNVRLYVDVTLPPDPAALERLQEQLHAQERVQLAGLDSAINYYGRLAGAIQIHGTS